MAEDYEIFTEDLEVKTRTSSAIMSLASYGIWAFSWRPAGEAPTSLRTAPDAWGLKGLPVHSEYHGIYVCDRSALPADVALGAAFPAPADRDGWTGITVTTSAEESQDTISLRVMHELLHCLNLPADDMAEHLDEVFSVWDRLLYHLVGGPSVSSFYAAYFRNSFERQYYEWLLDQWRSS